MILGQCISKWDGNAYYSPAFPRGALNATFVVQVTNIYDSPTFVVTVQDKASTATSWADHTAFDNITATGTYTKDVDGLEELVRLKYEFSGGDAVDAVRIIVPPPVWRDAV